MAMLVVVFLASNESLWYCFYHIVPRLVDYYI